MKVLTLVLLFATSSCFAFLPKSFTANFEQVRKSIISGKVKKSVGTIDYMYPSNLRLEMKGEESLILVSNKQKTWYYRPPFIEGEKGELTVNDSGKTELSGFFDLLKNGLVNGPLYQVTTKGLEVELRFTKSGITRSGLKKATLVFSNKIDFKNLSAIHIIQKTNKSLTLNLKNLRVDQNFSSSHFVFTAPKI